MIAYGGLLVAQNFVQGIGLLLLIPFLGMVGIGSAGPSDQEPVGRFLFETLGLPATLPVLMLVFVGLVGLREGIRFGETYLGASIRVQHVADLRVRLFEAIAKARWPFVAALRTTDVQTALQREAGLVSAAIFSLLRAANDVGTALMYATVSLIVAPALASVALVVTAVLLVLTGPIIRRARTSGLTLRDAEHEMNSVVKDHMEGVREAKAFGAEERAVGVFREFVHRSLHNEQRFFLGHAATTAAMGVAAAAVLAALAFLATLGPEWMRISGSSLLVLIFLFSRLVPTSSSLSRTVQQLAQAAPSFDVLARLIGRAEEAEERQALTGTGAFPDLKKEIRVRDVVFRYPEQEAPVISGLNMSLPAGSMTALVGASGAGKTTVADLVLGLLFPDSGAVEVDGVAIGPHNASDWRRRTAYVPQHTFLFSGSVRENLRLAKPEATDEELRVVLAAASLEEVIERLPGGLDTVVGDGGMALSGGERQRLAVARALLRKPALLVLDEATSGLDAGTEGRLMEMLLGLRGGPTMLVISHRKEIEDVADHVVRLPQ
jgi:ATP-binding cassette subfamily C protein